MLELAERGAAQAVRDGFGGLRIFGDMTWALRDVGKLQRLVEYEVEVNRRIARTPACAVCQYDRTRFSPELLRDVIRAHPLVVVGGRLCRNVHHVPPEELIAPDPGRELDRLLRSIQDREDAESALRESERRLARALQGSTDASASRLATVGTLAAGVAHEINNPLAYVTANLRYLSEQLQAAPSQEALGDLLSAVRDAEDGARRVREVVQGLRRFAGPTGDGRRLPVDVAVEIEAAVGITRNQVACRARLTLDLAPGLPPVVAGPNELGQVIVNLLVNASQAIPEGRAAENEVRVSARVVDGRIAIEVSDSGTGIPEEVLPRVFDPFFTTKQAGGGTGLGLAVCHGAVAAMDGQSRRGARGEARCSGSSCRPRSESPRSPRRPCAGLRRGAGASW